MSLNLHDMVRRSITRNLEDQEFRIYRSAGQTNVNGVNTAVYLSPENVKGNFQSEGDSALAHADLAGQNSIVRKIYLYSDDCKKNRPWSIYRPFARSGDYLLDRNGGWWFVNAVTEDFSDSGWECLRVIFQTVPPKLVIKT